MYEARQDITKAFANSGIELLLGIPNELVPKLAANLAEAFNWVTQNVVSFPNSGISAIIVGNEWLLDPLHDPSLLLPAMLNVYTVLTTSQLLSLDLTSIKVSTSHALNVLGISFPPSSAQFDASLLSVLTPIFKFLEKTGSFFMVNIFPYYAYVNDANVSLDLALFEAKEAVRDPKTGLNYTNLFDLQLDAVYAALDAAILQIGKGLVEATAGDNGNATESDPRASALNKGQLRRMKDQQLERRSSNSASAANRRIRPRVLVGESGWPSGSGGSGSVPHSSQVAHLQLSAAGVMPPAAHAVMSRGNDVDVALRVQADGQRLSAAELVGSVRGASAPAPAGGGCGFSARVCGAATVENARKYNQGLIRHVRQAGRGTPANPTTPIHAFIFALFDENLKQPPGPEQHYGLFFPTGQPVYPITFH
ncbi:hypothetical protein L7F22_025539 [Adiantum nelumboides]|nr:hypothetical protein [Adiantum nelumboides]